MDLNVKGKKVLIRVDFNVPLNEAGDVTDETRLKAALPTIQYVLEQEGTAILMSHFGRPLDQRKKDGSIDRNRFSLQHVLKPLSGLLGKEVQFIGDTVGQQVKDKIEELRAGEVLLLENTRFHEGEKTGDEAFARDLACLADIYINDAFGAAHRDHASTSTIARLFPRHRKSFGLLMEKELAEATHLLNHPEQPFTAVIGGAKVSDKIGLLESLLERVRHIVIGGGMAYTLIKAQGGQIGDSLFEESSLDMAGQLFDKASEAEVNIHLPVDSIIAEEIDAAAEKKRAPSDEIPPGWKGLDIGPGAVEHFTGIILKSKTIFWNGPMGVFELKPFSKGTEGIARAIGRATDGGAYSLVGGGDSVAALNQSGLSDEMSFISTGGGAMLSLIKGESLPAIEAMHDWQ